MRIRHFWRNFLILFISLLSMFMLSLDCYALTTFTGTLDAKQLNDGNVHTLNVTHSGKLVVILEKDPTLTEVTVNISTLDEAVVSTIVESTQSCVTLDIPEEFFALQSVVPYEVEVSVKSGNGNYKLIVAEPNEVTTYELLNNLVVFDYEKISLQDEPLRLVWKNRDMEEDHAVVDLRILDFAHKNEIVNGTIRDLSGYIALPENLPVGKYTIIAEKKSDSPGQRLSIHAIGARSPKGTLSNGMQIQSLNTFNRSADVTLFTLPDSAGITMDGFIEGALEKGQIYEYEIALTGSETNLWVITDQNTENSQKPCLKAELTNLDGTTSIAAEMLGSNLAYFPISQKIGNYRLRLESDTNVNYAYGVEYVDAYAQASLVDCVLKQVVNSNEEYTYDIDFAEGAPTTLQVQVTNPSSTVSSFQLEKADSTSTPVTRTLQPGETVVFTLSYDTLQDAGVTIKGVDGQIVGKFPLVKTIVIKRDEKEKNNTLSQANLLLDNVPTEGTISAKGDLDYYTFILSWKSSVYIKLKNIPTGTNYDLILYSVDAQKQLVEKKRCTNSTNKDEEIAMMLEPGIYAIKVFSASGVSPKKYQLGYAAIYSENRFAITTEKVQQELKDVSPGEDVYVLLYSKSYIAAYPQALEWAKKHNQPLPLPTGGPVVASSVTSSPSSMSQFFNVSTQSELKNIERYQKMQKITEQVEKYNQLKTKEKSNESIPSTLRTITSTQTTTLVKFRLQKGDCLIYPEAAAAVTKEDQHKLFHTVYGRLAATGNHCYVYIDDNYTKTKALKEGVTYAVMKSREDAEAQKVMQQFEGNFTKLTNLFGTDPAVNLQQYAFTEGKTYILLTPLEMGGFFWPVNMFSDPKYLATMPQGWTLAEFEEYKKMFNELDLNGDKKIDPVSEWRSNQKKIIFVNSTMLFKHQIGTLVHEFQHLLYYHNCYSNGRSSSGETWWNEALSCLAKDLIGYGYAQKVVYEDCVQQFSASPNHTSVLNWTGGADSYGASYLFARYVYERYGQNQLSQICKSKDQPIKAFEQVTGKTFETIYSDWVRVLLINQLRNSSFIYKNDTYFDSQIKYKITREKLAIQPENKIFHWAGWGPIFIKLNPVIDTTTNRSVSITLPTKYPATNPTNFVGIIVRWKKNLYIN